MQNEQLIDNSPQFSETTGQGTHQDSSLSINHHDSDARQRPNCHHGQGCPECLQDLSILYELEGSFIETSNTNNKNKNDDDHKARNGSSNNENEEGEAKVSTLKTFISLLTPFFGTGMLALPYFYYKAGLFSSIVLTFLVTWIVQYCMALTLRAGQVVTERKGVTASPSSSSSSSLSSLQQTGQRYVTFEDIGFYAFGTSGSWMVESLIVFSQVGFCCGFVSYMSHTLTFLYSDISRVEYVFFLTPLLILAALPRSFKYLSIPSIIGVSLFFICLFLILTDGFLHHCCHRSFSQADMHTSQLSWTNFPSIYACCCYSQQMTGLLFHVQNSMQSPSDFPWLLRVLMLFVACCFATFAVFGVLFYGDSVTSVLTKQLGDALFPGKIISILLMISLLLNFAICLFPAVKLIDRKIDRYTRYIGIRQKQTDQQQQQQQEHREEKTKQEEVDEDGDSEWNKHLLSHPPLYRYNTPPLTTSKDVQDEQYESDPKHSPTFHYEAPTLSSSSSSSSSSSPSSSSSSSLGKVLKASKKTSVRTRFQHECIRLGCRLMTVAIVIAVVVLVKDFATIINVVGGVANALLAIALPCCFHFKICVYDRSTPSSLSSKLQTSPPSSSFSSSSPFLDTNQNKDINNCLQRGWYLITSTVLPLFLALASIALIPFCIVQ